MSPLHSPQNRHLLLVGLLLLLLPAVSFGADTSTAVTVGKLYAGFFTPLDNFATLLAPYGSKMVFAMVTLHVVAGGMMLMAGTSDPFDLFVQGIKLSIVGGLALAAVTQQAWLGALTGMSGPVNLPTAIMEGMHILMQKAADAGAAAIASAAAGGAAVPGAMAPSWFSSTSSAPGSAASSDMIIGIFDGIFGALRQLLAIPLFSEEASLWDKLKGAVDGSLTLAAVYWFFSIIMYVMAAGLLVLELIGAELMIKFAIAFTPLMVPWILFKPMQFLFTGWLKTIVIGSVAFIIGMLLMSGFASFATTMAYQISHAPADTWAARVSIAMLFLPLFLGSFMFFMIAPKAMNIASGLISGGGIEGITLKALGHHMRAANTVASAPRQLAGSAANIKNMATTAASGVSGAADGARGGFSQGKGAMAKLTGSVKGAMSGGRTGLDAATASSPGGVAARGVATASNKTPTPQEMKTAASHANSTYAQARAQGQGHHMAAGAANRAASASLASVSRTPSSRPATPAASAAAPVSPAPVPPRRLRKQTP